MEIKDRNNHFNIYTLPSKDTALVSLSSHLSSSSSFSQSSKAGYEASLAASTIGSWDDEEQDYDEKSTKKVWDMMNQMDNILYQDGKSDSDSQELITECLEWNNLFPHLR